MIAPRIPSVGLAPVRYDAAGSVRRIAEADHPPPVAPLTLLGRDHEALGRLATAALGDQVGVAISRGAVDKPHWYLDANEDAVLAARGHGGWLLAVADGHHGRDAAEAAVAGVATAAPALDDGWSSPELVASWAVDAARTAVAERLGDGRGGRPGSRTALTVAVVRDGTASVATYGDTCAWRVGTWRARAVGAPTAFLGPRSPAVPVRTVRLRPGDALVLASDGLPDALGGGLAPALTDVRRETPPAARAAGGLVARALASGACDNVTALVWAGQR